ncbi:MAG: hypothetical protein DWQ01_14975 [Planctomycetota bacterium]|nr:MAG: hypothetical protein DWQ01_14975 [Planctomycetota bacterium]
MEENESLSERCQKEVVDLHRFFEDWFSGRLRKDEDAFVRFTRVTAPFFQWVSPEGEAEELLPLCRRLHQAQGIHMDSSPRFRIWIERFQVRFQTEDVLLCTYEEHQEIQGRRSGRLSTALFRNRAKTPHGVEWVHVHEVWLPGLGPGHQEDWLAEWDRELNSIREPKDPNPGEEE